MDWNKITPELERKLDPKHVKPAPKGKFGDYVDGYHVVSEANRIFGHGGWSYTVTRLEKVSEQTVTLKGQNGPYDQYRVGYLCTVAVKIGDAVREGCAVGSGMGSPNSMADHHESAVKEAETDALKRALRSFGNTFGLALYDKEKANVGRDDPPAERPKAPPAPKVSEEEAVNWFKANIAKADSIPKLEAWFHDAKRQDALSRLGEEARAEVEVAKNGRCAELGHITDAA